MLSPKKRDIFFLALEQLRLIFRPGSNFELSPHSLPHVSFFSPRKKRGKFRASLSPHVTLLSSTHRRLKPSCPDAIHSQEKRNGIFVGTVPPPLFSLSQIKRGTNSRFKCTCTARYARREAETYGKKRTRLDSFFLPVFLFISLLSGNSTFVSKGEKEIY